MKKLYFLILLVFFNLSYCFGATYISQGTGDWDIAGTWDNGIPPLSNNDAVTISSGHTITKTGNLSVTNNNIVFHVYGTLIINGTLQVKNNLEFNVYSGGSVQITDLTADNNANIDISGGGTVTITNDLTLGSPGNVNVDGDLTVQGDVSTGKNTTLSGTGTVNIDGNCTDVSTGNFCTSGPLPVELLYFNAGAEFDHVTLSWATASELNNEYFTLEKSRNGKDFELLGKVAGNGTTSEQIQYAYSDKNPYLGLSYYRLSQTDYDGTTEVFPLVSVLFTDDKAGFTISPNPLKDQMVNLKVSDRTANEKLTLKLYDLRGKIIELKEFTTDNYGNIQVGFQQQNQLKGGTYIFELGSDSSKEYLKVIVE